MKTRSSILIVNLVLAGLLYVDTVSGQYQRKIKQVDDAVSIRMEASNVPGMAVGVIVNGKVLLKKGYGFSNIELRSPVTSRSVFNLMSISKTFTAIGLLMLYEEGRLSLDDPISRHITELPDAWRPVTIRQLLNNTSGIPSFVTNKKPLCNEGQDVSKYKKDDVLKEVSCYPLDFQPGEKWSYSDTNFYLAGMIIEKISGVFYGNFINNRIFQPLGMKTGQIFDYTKVIPDRASGYVISDSKLTNAYRFDIDEYANGGLIGSLDDMLQFENVFITERSLKRQTIDMMLANARLNNGDIVRSYGIGVGLTPYNGKKRFGHTGGGAGFSTAFTHFPDEKVTVIVLSNLEHDGIGEFANNIASIFFRL